MLLSAISTLALAAGCVHEGDVGGGYTATYVEPAPAPAPSLYYVSPGVQVVAYSDYPVFYADNYYWRYDSGLWYRSGYYGGGWVVWNDVPRTVRTIDRPHRYVRYAPTYRGSAYRGSTYRGSHRHSAPASRTFGGRRR